jgi:hypothetical protein
MSFIDVEVELHSLKAWQKCGCLLLPARLRHRTASPRVVGHVVDSILGDHHLQHEEGIKPNYQDLKVLVPDAGLRHCRHGVHCHMHER